MADKSIRNSAKEKSVERYCRKVCIAWCLFFILNAGISAFTALKCSDAVWSLYNGGISYALMGLMFAVEYIIRIQVNKKMPSEYSITKFKNNSRKDDYVEGVEQYRTGYKMFTSHNPEASVEEFKKSKETFQNLYDVISKARAGALKKIEDAKKRVDESEATAAAADKVAPLGNQPVKGIEAADAKLLEDDDFSYTENTEIEVESTSLTSSEEVTE